MTFAMLGRYWKQIAALLIVAMLCGYSYRKGEDHEHAKLVAHLAQDARDARQASEAARQAERKLSLAMSQIAEAYEQGKLDAERESKAVVSSLRAGTLRLRKQWQGCEADRVASGSGEPDAEAADRAESAGRIIRAAREADEQIKGLQDILRAERK